MADILEPQDLAVRRVEKRHPKPVTVVDRIGSEPPRVAFRLSQDSLWPQSDLLGLDHAQSLVPVPKGVISGPVLRFEFLDGGPVSIDIEWAAAREGDHLPASCAQARIDPFLPGATSCG